MYSSPQKNRTVENLEIWNEVNTIYNILETRLNRFGGYYRNLLTHLWSDYPIYHC